MRVMSLNKERLEERFGNTALFIVCVYIYILLKSFYTNKMRMKTPKNVKYIRYKVRRTEGKGIVLRNQGTEVCGKK